MWQRLFLDQKFKTYAELYQCVDGVVAKLEHAGLPQAAKLLADWRATAFTTSNELLFELGAAVKQIEKQYRVDADIKADLKRLRAQVPRYGLFR